MTAKAKNSQQRSWGWRVREDKANDCMLKEDRNLLAARFEERRLAWEKARRHGMAFFVFTRWTIWFGGLMALCILVFDFWPYPKQHHINQALYVFPILFVYSTLMGVWDWYSNEEKYRKK
jgi:uncharacterized membrane protein YqjE